MASLTGFAFRHAESHRSIFLDIVRNKSLQITLLRGFVEDGLLPRDSAVWRNWNTAKNFLGMAAMPRKSIRIRVRACGKVDKKADRLPRDDTILPLEGIWKDSLLFYSTIRSKEVWSISSKQQKRKRETLAFLSYRIILQSAGYPERLQLKHCPIFFIIKPLHLKNH